MSEVIITVKETGSYSIEGDVKLVDHLGQPIPTTPGKRVSLCRCGASATKPFCDGTHSKIGFLAAEKAQREFDAQQARDENKAP